MNIMDLEPTIGQRVKEVFETLPKNRDIDWLAAELHCDRRNIYRIFRRTNIDIDMLGRLSQILQHDFFADLSQELGRQPVATPGEPAE